MNVIYLNKKPLLTRNLGIILQSNFHELKKIWFAVIVLKDIIEASRIQFAKLL